MLSVPPAAAGGAHEGGHPPARPHPLRRRNPQLLGGRTACPYGHAGSAFFHLVDDVRRLLPLPPQADEKVAGRPSRLLDPHARGHAGPHPGVLPGQQQRGALHAQQPSGPRGPGIRDPDKASDVESGLIGAETEAV